MVIQIVCIQLSQFTQRLRLILVKLEGIRVECVLDNVLLQLLMFIECVEMAQCLGKTAQMVVNFKLPTQFRQFLKFAQKWQILPRILQFCQR